MKIDVEIKDAELQRAVLRIPQPLRDGTPRDSTTASDGASADAGDAAPDAALAQQRARRITARTPTHFNQLLYTYMRE